MIDGQLGDKKGVSLENWIVCGDGDGDGTEVEMGCRWMDGRVWGSGCFCVRADGDGMTNYFVYSNGRVKDPERMETYLGKGLLSPKAGVVVESRKVEGEAVLDLPWFRLKRRLPCCVP